MAPAGPLEAPMLTAAPTGGQGAQRNELTSTLHSTFREVTWLQSRRVIRDVASGQQAAAHPEVGDPGPAGPPHPLGVRAGDGWRRAGGPTCLTV